MNKEEFKKYTNKMYENIENKLERDSEEFEFFYLVAESLNKVCEENKALENALDEIEKYIKENKNKTYTPYGDDEDYDYDVSLFEEDVDVIEEIIKKAKGE